MTGSPFTEATRIKVIERDGPYCRYCGFGPMRVDWEPHNRTGRYRIYGHVPRLSVNGHRQLDIDHVVPKSRGGSHDEDNLVVACSDCNRRKNNNDVHGPLRRPWPIKLPPRPEPEPRPFRRESFL